MRTIRVAYHREAQGRWWADSPDLQNFTAGGDTLDEVRALVREGVPFYVGVSPSAVELVESGDDVPDVVDALRGRGV